ncbi:MAG: hypothetical protein KA419_15795 [Acidobacteria bacterium]|nr:hypothetical protein [Acidobacteriota bacterium]
MGFATGGRNVRIPLKFRGPLIPAAVAFLLVKPANTDRWQAFRDVLVVDRKPVRDRQERLHRLFVESPDSLEKIRAESCRFNLGPVFRDFNTPTTALHILERANLPRFDVRKSGEETVDGVKTWKLHFSERGSPTMFRNQGGEVLVHCEARYSGCRVYLVEAGSEMPGTVVTVAGER